MPYRPIRPGWFGRWFICEMDAPPRRKLKTPKQGVPAAPRHKLEVLDSFVGAHTEVRSLIYQARDLDLNRIHFRNPFIRVVRYSVGAALLVICAHDRRHRWQADQVRSAIAR